MKRKVIVYFVFKTAKSAGTRISFEHVDRLSKIGFETRIVSLFGRKPSWFVLHTPVYSVFSALLMNDIDILISTFWPLSYIMLFMRAKKKYTFLQGWEVDFYKNKIVKYLVNLSLKLPYDKIVISTFLEEKMKETNPFVKTHKIDYLEIDRSIYKPLPHKIKNKTPKVLSIISWYNTAKGPDLLVRIVKRLKKIHPHYSFSLISLEDYPYEPVFDTFVSNPTSKVIAEMLRRSDLFLVTSRSEGYYIPGLEAMACGCPMITTNCGGINDYAVHNENAIIVENYDDIWKQDICEDVLYRTRLRKKLILNGYKTVKKYNWKSIIMQLKRIYES